VSNCDNMDRRRGDTNPLQPVIAIPHFPEDIDITGMVAEGLQDFALGASARASSNPEWTRGWWIGWARCYGQGVKASALAVFAEVGEEVDVVENPYPQFSGPWEAWASGFEAEDHL
jgi:hypothetical protein